MELGEYFAGRRPDAADYSLMTGRVVAVAEALRDGRRPLQLVINDIDDLLLDLSLAELHANIAQEELIVAANLLATATRRWAFAIRQSHTLPSLTNATRRCAWEKVTLTLIDFVRETAKRETVRSMTDEAR